MRRTRGLKELAGGAYWREADARRIVAAWRRSGAPVSVFAGDLGIDPRRVSRWATRLGAVPRRALTFVPVHVAEAPPASGGAPIDIELTAGRRIRVAPGFATDDLRRVLALLDERVSC
jgi:predicted oxidoreductase